MHIDSHRPSTWVTARDGIRLALYTWGDIDKPTIVLVHGYPDSARIWKQVAEKLANDFHVVAYDVRGAGASAKPARLRDYRLDCLSADLCAVIDKASPDRPVHLVAHDWGSIQTWESVTNPKLRTRIASYTSLSGPCLDHVGFWLRQQLRERHFGKLARQARHSWYIAAFHLPLLAPLAWKLGGGRWPAFIARLEGTSIEPDPLQVDNGRQGIALYRANMLPRLLHPRNRFTEVPVLLLVARKDPFVRPDLYIGLERWVPQLEREDLELGHWSPLSQPTLIAERVTAFVRRLTPSTRGSAKGRRKPVSARQNEQSPSQPAR